jgi:hypothetical protein
MATIYTSSALLKAMPSSVRIVLIVCFWIWGILGLLGNSVYFWGLAGSVGVGTSTYLAVELLYWIGGMLLFGLGGVLTTSSYDFKRPEMAPKAAPPDYKNDYQGFPYRQLSDGRIEILTANGPRTYASLAALDEAVER